MSDRDDLNDIDNLDDDFDYLKEIAEIEAQERELEEQRRKKKAELQKRREEREREAKKSDSKKKREQKEERKEAEWLGSSARDEVETVAVPKKKKNGKVAIIMAVIVILILAGAGGAYAYKTQMDKKTVADFQSKLTAFQTEKMQNADFGSHQAYFDDFFQQCQAAIDDKDLSRIAALNQQWAEVESQYAAVSEGKSSLTAFADSAKTAFANYTVTDTYKETYDTLMQSIEDAKKENDYNQVADLQKQIDALTTNLKADNMKLIQNLKNDIASIDLDEEYTNDDQKKQLASYNEHVEKAIADGNYKQAIDTLNGWKSSASAISSAITEQKKTEAAKAESEAAAKRESESKAAESRAEESRAESESKANETASTSSNNNSNNNSSSSSKGDFVFPNSNKAYLTAADLKNLSSYQLMIARNEIYARRGRKFSDPELRNYFNSKSWYHGTIEPQDFSISVFNDYELKNIDLIQEYE